MKLFINLLSSLFKKMRSFRFLRKMVPYLSLVGIFLCLIIGVCFYEVIPKYINLPIYTPGESRSDDWNTVMYATFLDERPHSIISGRTFVLRKEVQVEDENATWASIADYFDSELGKIGWVKVDHKFKADLDCSDFMPESNFLKPGEDGYIHYRKKDWQVGNIYTLEDLACVAIWEKYTESERYSVVLLTVKQSLFKYIFLFME